MIKLKDLLEEGVFDKGILKAVFMAGGPGSGKSYVAGEIFGIPKKINVSIENINLFGSDKIAKYSQYQAKKFTFHKMAEEYLNIYSKN